MNNYSKLAKDIVSNVGGIDNINGLRHCVTRLRFNLKDIDKANTNIIKDLEGVANVMVSAGQYQVVIGNEVADVYQAIEDKYHINESKNTSDDTTKKPFKEEFIDILSTVFTPLIGLLSATGIIKGVSILFVGVGWISVDSGTFKILQIIGDSLLSFSPIFVGYTSAKKFGLNQFVGMAIGATLIHPEIKVLMGNQPLFSIFAGSAFESSVFTTFLKVPVILMNYSGTVIPIIFATYLGAKVEKFVTKFVPKVVKLFLIPALTLLITVPITFIVIGPVATWMGQLIAEMTMVLYNISSVLTGILSGAIWQVLVVLGLHHALMPLSLNNMQVVGYDSVISARLVSIFATFGVTMAIYFKAKKQNDNKLKTVSIPAAISAFFGITEPAIYGVLLPVKKAFSITIISGAIGGGVSGYFDAKLYSQGGLGILALPSYLNPNGGGIDSGFIGIVSGCVVGMSLGFILFTIFGDNKVKGSEDSVENKGEILAPVQGIVMQLEDVSDDVFASKVIGDGIAVVPTKGEIKAPFNGIVTSLFPTKHAVGLTSDDGIELLIHIGIDTVNLEGKYFENFVSQGDKVKKGQRLINFDIDKIIEEGYVLETPIIVTNINQYEIKRRTNKPEITTREVVFELERKI